MALLDEKRILIEDDHFIAVKKEAGELVVADRFKIEKNILLHKVGEYLRSKGHKLDESGRDLYPVHRLDRETSGVVLFAKNQESHRELSRLFENREMHKTYWTLTAGAPAWDHCQCDVPLSRAEGKKGRGRALVDLSRGKPASTRFEVKERFGDIAWVEAYPLTGRLHQIRLHLKVLGTPILFDSAYWDENWKSKYWRDMQFKRLPLHARRIEFVHPFSKEHISIECPMDEDLRNFLNFLKTESKYGLPAELGDESGEISGDGRSKR